MSIRMKTKLRFVVYKSTEVMEDPRDWWISSCVDINVMTGGYSPRESFKTLRGILSLTISEALSEGLDPFNQPSAITEVHEKWAGRMKPSSSEVSLESDEWAGVFEVAYPYHPAMRERMVTHEPEMLEILSASSYFKTAAKKVAQKDVLVELAYQVVAPAEIVHEK